MRRLALCLILASSSACAYDGALSTLFQSRTMPVDECAIRVNVHDPSEVTPGAFPDPARSLCSSHDSSRVISCEPIAEIGTLFVVDGQLEERPMRALLLERRDDRGNVEQVLYVPGVDVEWLPVKPDRK